MDKYGYVHILIKESIRKAILDYYFKDKDISYEASWNKIMLDILAELGVDIIPIVKEIRGKTNKRKEVLVNETDTDKKTSEAFDKFMNEQMYSNSPDTPLDKSNSPSEDIEDEERK